MLTSSEGTLLLILAVFGLLAVALGTLAAWFLMAASRPQPTEQGPDEDI